MRLHSEAVKADFRRRMGPPHRQSVAEITGQPGLGHGLPVRRHG